MARLKGKPAAFKLQKNLEYLVSFTVSEAIDPDRIMAEHKNGGLTVHLPKAEVAKLRRITVQGE